MSTNFRKERVEKLLDELVYELQIGVHQRELEEWLGLRKVIGRSAGEPNCVVVLDVKMRPVHEHELDRRALDVDSLRLASKDGVAT